MTIQSLIERLEAGETGPETDMDVLDAVGCVLKEYTNEAGKKYRVAAWPIEGFRNEPVWYPRITSSLDACRALHERLLPGWGWCIAKDGGLCVWEPGAEGDTTKCVIDVQGGREPPAAWLIAILQAFAAKEGE